MHVPDSTSHSRIVRSSELDATFLPPGLKATLLTQSSCPSKQSPTLVHVWVFHTRTARSRDPVATYEPFGQNETLRIRHPCASVSSKTTSFVMPSRTLSVPSARPSAIIRFSSQRAMHSAALPRERLSVSVPVRVSQILSVPSYEQENMRPPSLCAAMPVTSSLCPFENLSSQF